MPYADKEKEKAFQKEYRANNKTRLKELQKEWRERPGNRERNLRKTAEWIEKNGHFDAEDSMKPWRHNEHIIINERENGEYKYRILELCKMINRSYRSIQVMRKSMEI